MPEFPYIFTFYSYKGGVGRSMALLNTAYALVARGRHVLVVDMDLEAPGVSGFLSRQDELVPSEKVKTLDVLNLLDEALNSLDNDQPPEVRAKNLPDLRNYARPVAKEKLEPLQPQAGEVGRLDVVAADEGRNYSARLANLRLETLGREKLIEVSRVLHHYFKQQRFANRPLGLEDFEPDELTAYDYVLIDSRTGITDIGGLCIGPLADRLVVLTGLNDQNVQGTQSFLKEAGIHPSPSEGPWDDADPAKNAHANEPRLGPKPTLLVASPVPTGELQYKQRRLAELQKLLGLRPLSISYHPQMALFETVFVRDYPEEYIAQEYRNLADRMMRLVLDDEESLTEVLRTAANKGTAGMVEMRALFRLAPLQPSLAGSWWDQLDELDTVKEWLLRRKILASLSKYLLFSDTSFDNWGQTLSDEAKTKYGEEADRFFVAASKKFAAAINIKADKHGTFNNWGNTLSDQAGTKNSEEADQLFAAAGEKFANAIKIKPDRHVVFYNWGTTLSEQAKTKQGREAESLCKAAFEKYAAAVKIKPDYYEVFINWGITLSNQARSKQNEEAYRLFDSAGEKFSMAVRIKPDDYETLNYWGAALADQASMRRGKEADRLFAMAGEKFATAVEVTPASPQAFYNWGISLSRQANTKQGEEADHLFAASDEKFAQAVKMKPDHYQTYNNWGGAILERAKNKHREEAEHLYTVASEKFEAALKIRPNYTFALANMGYTAALKGRVAETIRWLKKAQNAGKILTKKLVSADTDFDLVRQDPEFIAFMETLP